jgi:hypothetical protein
MESIRREEGRDVKRFIADLLVTVGAALEYADGLSVKVKECEDVG